MKYTEPSREACLAAELYACYTGRIKILPGRAAQVAATLCAIGRRYNALQVRMCNDPKLGTEEARKRAQERCAAYVKQAREEIAGFKRAKIDDDHDLFFACVSTPKGFTHYTATTACL